MRNLVFVLISIATILVYSCKKDISIDPVSDIETTVIDTIYEDSSLTFFDVIEDSVMNLALQSLEIELADSSIHFDFDNLEFLNYSINPNDIYVFEQSGDMNIVFELFPDSISDKNHYSLQLDMDSDTVSIFLSNIS